MKFKFKRAVAQQKPIPKEVSNNPYVQSRLMYEDIYGCAEERYKKSRRFNFLLLGCVFLSILGVIYIGSESKFIPYVVEVQNGQVIYANTATESNIEPFRSKMAYYFLQGFIQSARTVSVDGTYQADQERKAFALTTGAATTKLSGYFDTHDPFKRAEKQMVSVTINYIKHISDSYEVAWTETVRDSTSGQVISQHQFSGTFMTQWGQPSQSNTVLKNNPFGFYISNFSWTEVMGNE